MYAVLNESMRLFPPVTFFVTREAEKDFKYKDITIPAGCDVICSVHELHHDPKLWEEPEKFDPERFLGTNKGKINPVAFQPFGTGPRNCIGMRFAILEIKLALARLLCKYKLVAGPSTEVDIQVDYKPITMTPKNGVFVRAIPL
jgi:cytochrome P450